MALVRRAVRGTAIALNIAALALCGTLALFIAESFLSSNQTRPDWRVMTAILVAVLAPISALLALLWPEHHKRQYFSGGGHSIDPHAEVREPKPERPGGRDSAVALMEPDETYETTNCRSPK